MQRLLARALPRWRGVPRKCSSLLKTESLLEYDFDEELESSLDSKWEINVVGTRIGVGIDNEIMIPTNSGSGGRSGLILGALSVVNLNRIGVRNGIDIRYTRIYVHAVRSRQASGQEQVEEGSGEHRSPKISKGCTHAAESQKRSPAPRYRIPHPF
ncbi:hypothetical protein EVAR_11801_1 [Eumeta japonica]|uniref:Uncharacterized protein n=1 Tax=Eumeta variegata TaxID=151549 RepID=A0A4C1UPT3_EUMVA|nr:hypothetical protein EVAR_11801_1 [Eumeta japonica]